MASRTEYAKYSKADLEEMAKFSAKLALVGSLYRGNITVQTTSWCEDGGISVLTHHVPAPE